MTTPLPPHSTRHTTGNNHRAVYYILFVLLLLFALSFATASAQVSVSSNVLFVCDDAPLTTLTITNTSGQTKQVTLATRFGMPVWNELGRVTMMYGDGEGKDASATMHLDASRLVVFTPTQFTLRAGASEKVQFKAPQKKDADTGSYWMRVSITSESVSATPAIVVESGPAAESGDVGESGPTVSELSATPPATSDLKGPDVYVQSIPLLYVRGKADVRLSDRKFVIRSDSGFAPGILVETAPVGNAPFLGLLGVLVLRDGYYVASRTVAVSLYRPGHIRLVPIEPGLEQGEYTVQLYWTLGRGDILPQYAPWPKTLIDAFTFRVESGGDLVINEGAE